MSNNIVLTEEEYDNVLNLLENASDYMRHNNLPEWFITGNVGQAMSIMIDAYNRSNG